MSVISCIYIFFSLSLRFSVCIAPLSELFSSISSKMVQMSMFVYTRFGGAVVAAAAELSSNIGDECVWVVG